MGRDLAAISLLLYAKEERAYMGNLNPARAFKTNVFKYLGLLNSLDIAELLKLSTSINKPSQLND
jgi:hypothetical protein